ncbi:uncharacterized protein C10orf120 homolog [Monodelphis domestica]|uniref:uncharacterized protein C10orf120 homolog n=1 Tax=Monodelphis domestica TaxID=13616 RepID=UPI0024E20CEE|nr:uncharacterized protein C10orf120 homolog [Monodelphis domestica]
MLYMQLEAERAIAEWLLREKKSLQGSKTPPHTENSISEESFLDSDRQSHEPIKDSDWLTLSAQEQLAWVKNTQDPRIARGLRSPLEKKILRLGGTHSAAAKKLLAQKYQEERKGIHKFKSSSLDYRLSRAEAYYTSSKQDEIMAQLQRYFSPDSQEDSELFAEEEIWHPPKWDYLVSERELKQIERHIYRTEHARNLRSKMYLPHSANIQRKKFLPTAWTAESKEDRDNQKRPKTSEQMRELATKQIREHRERMIRGREVMQSQMEKHIHRIPKQFPLVSKPEVKRKQVRVYDWVAAYPLLQPRHGKQLEIRILIEKSKFKGEKKQEENKNKMPTCSVFLKIPPFLKSKLEKMNSY